MDIKQRIASCYKVQRMTALVDEDLRLIKKINQFLVKLEKNPDKESYILEIVNMLRTLLNLMDYNSLYLVMCEIIDMRYHEVLYYVFEEVDSLNTPDSFYIVKKFQDMADKNTLVSDEEND